MYTEIFNDDEYDLLNMSNDAIANGTFDELPGLHEGWSFDVPSYNDWSAEHNKHPLKLSWGEGATTAVSSTTGDGAQFPTDADLQFSSNVPTTAGEGSGITLTPGVSLNSGSGISLTPAAGISLTPSTGISLQPASHTPYEQMPNYGYYPNAYVEPYEDIFEQTSKRRKRQSDSLPDPVHLQSVFDHEEALSLLSSDDLLEYTTIAGVHRPFSEEERDLLAKIAKKIKNRESARRSRANKKNKMKDLEKQLKSRDNEIAALRSENELLKKENSDLRSQVNYFNSMLNNRAQNNNPQDLYSNPWASQTSTVLFIFLFTFGILLNFDSSSMNFFTGEHSGALPEDHSTYLREMGPPVLYHSAPNNHYYTTHTNDEPNKK
eukprot:TRINITY_DN11966_c0_g1_i1.p1 TRINITY_DN11966_c0_g1~~TRINITY_DN11966_c0_g1_i1.p1  ORF type:complete len:377 (+),score=78.95 TRINITY_DN11966_c0_g1_i1:57-1187(+)